VLYRHATAADPEFLPAHIDYLQLERANGNPLRVWRELDRRADLTPALRRCLLAIARQTESLSPRWMDLFRGLRSADGESACVAFGLSRAIKVHASGKQPAAEDEIAAARLAMSAFPEHHNLVSELIQSFNRHSRFKDAEGAALAAAARAPHPWHQLPIRALATQARLVRGDTAGAMSLLAESERMARRDGRPGVVHRFLEFSIAQTPVPRRAALLAERVRLERASGIPAVEVRFAAHDIGRLVEGGRMTDALAKVPRYAEIADRDSMVMYQMQLRLHEGRALVRSGRHAEALVALRRSQKAAELLGSEQGIAEALHQLMHAWEARGDWPAAARASDQFIAGAQLSTDPGVRVISWHDAAIVRRKAGWHAAADSLYRGMVSAIEREGTHFAFAAEYFEQLGDFGRALAYLRRAAVPSPNGNIIDSKELYASLTRLHLAMGNVDSAMATATLHDALTATADEILVPGVLVARGQPADAVLAMRRWAAVQASQGNMRGRIKALVALAEILAASAPAEAVAVAREAEVLARAQNFTPELVVALRIRGDAARRLGSHDALTTLREAQSLSTRAGLFERILTDVALGEAWSSARRHDEALRAFASAAAMTELSAGSVPGDVDAARFRAARVQAYNGALRSVRASSPSANLADAVLRWSARKKLGSRGDAATQGVRAAQSRLAPAEALVDFAVVDSAIVATVVTRAGSTVHELPMSAADALMLSGRIVGPIASVFAGHVDLSRAPFDAAAGARLFAGLLAPLEKHLVSATSLIVSADAPLHAVPFEALVTSVPDMPITYAVDRWAFRLVSAPVAGVAARPVSRSDRMLMVVGDAPGVQAERDLIVGRHGKRVDVLDGVRGTESNVRRMSPGFRILHIATHAQSNQRDPLSSHLSLASDSVHDGMLHYAEIQGTRSNYALVMLNACETSAGELLAGSGFMSLARAFMLSGASAVIATQWPVGAASAPLSAHFYERLDAGVSVSRALRDAKLHLRGDPATAHPFYWASHVLMTARL
jgi:tetratricopeptide (TPR) repeat protein